MGISETGGMTPSAGFEVGGCGFGFGVGQCHFDLEDNAVVMVLVDR